MSRTGQVTTAVRFHEVPDYRRARKYRVRACLHARASVPQADSENRAVAECRRGYQHVCIDGDAAENTFAEQARSLRQLRDVDSGRTRAEPQLRSGHFLLDGVHEPSQGT